MFLRELSKGIRKYALGNISIIGLLIFCLYVRCLPTYMAIIRQRFITSKG